MNKLVYGYSARGGKVVKKWLNLLVFSLKDYTVEDNILSLSELRVGSTEFSFDIPLEKGARFLITTPYYLVGLLGLGYDAAPYFDAAKSFRSPLVHIKTDNTHTIVNIFMFSSYSTNNNSICNAPVDQSIAFFPLVGFTKFKDTVVLDSATKPVKSTAIYLTPFNQISWGTRGYRGVTIGGILRYYDGPETAPSTLSYSILPLFSVAKKDAGSWPFPLLSVCHIDDDTIRLFGLPIPRNKPPDADRFGIPLD